MGCLVGIWKVVVMVFVALLVSKLYGVNATIITFIFLIYCFVLYGIVLFFIVFFCIPLFCISGGSDGGGDIVVFVRVDKILKN